ncbi:MAG: hypothetical protein EOP02_05085 [Proteobacteria bacterium]|nr:MAG: hypothetical protein EOP02_05085 [Pseudomonadota bacterium]
MTDFTDQRIEDLLQAGLVEGDLALGHVAPILRHLLTNNDSSLFTDEVVARVRGMLDDIARQLANPGEPLAKAYPTDTAEFSSILLGNSALLTHLHALALEWQLAERLHSQAGIDPVLSPLLQALIASSEAHKAAAAMTALAAQARFMQSVRRMEHPLIELPGDLFYDVLSTRETLRDADAAATEAENAQLRARFDESRTRIGLLAQMVTGMGGGVIAALSVEHAGVAFFISALATCSGQNRDLAVLATTEQQSARLALTLRAAGLKPEDVKEQMLALQPGISMPSGLDSLRSDQASALLAASAKGPK